MKFLIVVLAVIVTITASNNIVEIQKQYQQLMDDTPNNGSGWKDLANFCCEPDSCLPFLNDVCPFGWVCNDYCVEFHSVNGSCSGGVCRCYPSK